MDTFDDVQTMITHMDPIIYKAAATGNTTIIMNMSGNDLQVQLTPNKNTVLHIASQFGHLGCAKCILQLPSSSYLLRQVNLEDNTPLQLAAREGHSEVVKALTEAAKELHQEMESGVGADKTMLRMTNKEKDTALHEAVRYHHSEVVKLLIEEDPEFIHGANIKGYTPLYMAAERGYGDLVDIIIGNKNRTSPAHTGIFGRTALHAAVIRGDQEMTERLLKWKPALTKEVDENGWSPLHFAAYYGQTQMVKQLLEKSSDNAEVYFQTKDSKRTALHIAANRGSLEIVQLLLHNFPDCCEQVDGNGKNVFHFATVKMEEDDDIGTLLKNHWLSARGLINGKDSQGDTPLHLLSSSQIYKKYFIRDHRVDKMALNDGYLIAMDIVSRGEDIWWNKHDFQRELRESKEAVIGPFSFQKAIQEDNGRKPQSKSISELKRTGGTHLIVATLIATVTFAAGFTLPGGYNDDDGMAILTRKAAFGAFVVMDTIAMVLSVSAIFIYFFLAVEEEWGIVRKYLLSGFLLTMFAMVAMVTAFMTGLYAVLPHSSGLPIVTCIICSLFFISFYYLFRPIFRSERED